MGIDNILDLMTYANEQERQEANKYINLKGFIQYKRTIKFCLAEGYDKPTYKQVSHLYKYDKRLRDTLFKYIATIEEYIRATIGNRYENDVNKLTLTARLKSKLEEHNSLSITLEHLMLGEIKDLVLKNKEIFNDIYIIDDNLETNLKALISLRNKVGHHNFLLAEKYEKCIVNENEDQTLEANIKNLQQFLPKDFRKGFANSIRGCSERLVLPSKYVIDIQPLTIDEKIVEKISKQCYTIIMNDANSFAGFLDSVYLSLNDENWNHSQEILYVKAINHYKIDITSIGRDTEERLLNLYRICCPQFNLLFDEECLKQKKPNKASLKALFFKFMRKYEAFTSFMFGIILIIILIYGSFNMHQQEPDSWSADLYMGLASSVLAAIIIMYVNKRKKKKARKNEYIVSNAIYNTNSLINNLNEKFKLIQQSSDNSFALHYVDINNFVYRYCINTKKYNLQECCSYSNLIELEKKMFKSTSKLVRSNGVYVNDIDFEIPISNEEKRIANEELLQLKKIIEELRWEIQDYIYDLTQEKIKLEDTLF